MKVIKLISLAVSLTAAFSWISVPTAKADSIEGAGTALDPYQISNEEELRMISAASDACWELTDNIELSQDWTPVASFSGTLDGNGYKISGFYLYDKKNSWPNETAFIEENTGEIKNLHLDGRVEYESCHIGGAMLVFENYGIIENCSVQGTAKFILNNTHTTNESDFGVIASNNRSDGVIKNCYTRVSFDYSLNGGSRLNAYSSSGFVHINNGRIENCYSASRGKYGNDEFSGFVHYYTSGGSIESCYFDSDMPGIYIDDISDFYNVYPRTTSAMKFQANYSGWNFDSIWAMDESVNDGYPYLRNEKSVVVQTTGISLDKTSATLKEGEKITLTPIFTPENTSNKNVEWTSSDRYVATVEDGVVTGVAEGEATITAVSEDGGFKAECRVTVTAESEDPVATDDPNDTPEPDEDGGKCGNDLSWTFSDGTLTLTGSGAMEYDGYEAPWEAYSEYITKIEIPEGVTSIKENAFSYTAVTDVHVPASVTEIGIEAFDSCSSLESINVDASNASYSSQDGVLFSKDKTVLILYPAGKPGTSYTVPDGTQKILYAAFYVNDTLKDLYIPDSVTDIEYYAISTYKKLTVYGAEGGAAAAYVENFNKSATITLDFVPISSSSYDYTINYVSGDIPLNGKFRAEVSFTKNTDADMGVIIIALYDSDGGFSDYIFIDGDFEKGKTYVVGGTLSAFEGAKLKAFVWDGLNTMKPLSNTASSK